MSLQDPYGDVDEYRRHVVKMDEGSDQDILDDLIAVSRYLDKKLGRFFNHDDQPVTRIYQCHAPTLWIDDVFEEPEVALWDEVVLYDYRLWPEDPDLRPEPEQWQAIILDHPEIGADYAVTARRGWAAVPYPVRRGTLELTAVWRLESPRSTSRVNELDQVVGTSSQANKLVMDLVRQYSRKKYIWA